MKTERKLKMQTSDIFKNEIQSISNYYLRQIVIDTLNQSPSCIQVIPASSSGKYHSSAELEHGYVDSDGLVHTGGLVNHIKAVTGICLSLMESDIFKDIVSGHDAISKYELQILKDSAIASCIIHDCMKPDDTPEHKTCFEHPIKAAELFKECAKKYSDKDDNLFLIIDFVYGAVKSHMGKWCKSDYSDEVLPTPATGLQTFVHLCDYIASRRFIDFNFQKYNEGK